MSFALIASAANAIGGAPPAPWASPYAILEPPTVAPEIVAPQAAEEGRAAFEKPRLHCAPDDRTCLRHMQRERAPSGQE